MDGFLCRERRIAYYTTRGNVREASLFSMEVLLHSVTSHAVVFSLPHLPPLFFSLLFSPQEKPFFDSK